MDALVIGSDPHVSSALAAARAAAAGWRATTIAERVRIVRRARHALATRPLAIAATLGDRRPAAETLTAELLPLLAAARFLERRAAAILAPRRLRTGRPLWLMGVTSELHREPCGVVLILAPSNYPLFLPGAQILQALVAGNTVCAKPAPGCSAPLEALAGILTEAGLPDGVLQLLPEEAGAAASAAGFDRIVLTGSAETGRSVLAAAAGTLTPATMELSGNDAVLVLPGADLGRVADALAYGLRLNHGATCIAPRRVFVERTQAAALERALCTRAAAIGPAPVPVRIAERLAMLVTDAVSQGARVAHGAPMILAEASPGMQLLQEDVFAPWLALVPVADTRAAFAGMAACPYALGASIFGPEPAARAAAARVPAGSVCINDLIVPTADPRLPFGGRGRSGFGVTRGAEGLLEMTVIKTVSVRRGRFLPHLAPPRPDDAARFTGLIGLLYGGRAGVIAAMRGLLRRSP
jgi:acyl-CoA reductase-like NAD-dependent aldehyde dehydrogenase